MRPQPTKLRLKKIQLYVITSKRFFQNIQLVMLFLEKIGPLNCLPSSISYSFQDFNVESLKILNYALEMKTVQSIKDTLFWISKKRPRVRTVFKKHTVSVNCTTSTTHQKTVLCSHVRYFKLFVTKRLAQRFKNSKFQQSRCSIIT